MTEPAVLDPPTAGPAARATERGTAATGPPPRTIWRAVRVPLAAALVIVVGAIVVGLSANRFDRGRLDPRAVDPPGSRALAQLLTDRGVEVHRVKGGAPVVADADSTSTVFLPFPDFESAASLRALQRLDDSVRLVVVDPSEEVLTELAGDVVLGRPLDITGRDPGCDAPVATTAGDADLGAGWGRYRLREPVGGTICYDGALASVRHRGGGPLDLVGAADPFTNERLAARGNAALALGLLGGSDDVWWVLPNPAIAGAGERPGLFEILPTWVSPVVWQLVLICVLLALWRGRRLGPVVVEPLPVVVRAAESVEGRARLYHRGRARDRAAQALRDGARSRLVPLLGLGSDPSPRAVVETVAARSERPPEDVGPLLFGGAPTDDAQLVHLADALDQLVRTTLDSEGRRS